MAPQAISNMNHTIITENGETKIVISFGEDQIAFSSNDSFHTFFENIDLVYAKAFQEGEIHMLSNIVSKHHTEGE